jgi:hypothetical protein
MVFMLVCGGRVSWLLSLALLSACSASSGRSESPASAASAGSERAARPARESTRHARREEMTWEEYYVDVEQRARRAGGVVMWFNPPRPTRRANEPRPAEPAQTGGAPLSSSVR